MNIKLYLLLFSVAVSTILLLNIGAVAQLKADIIAQYTGSYFVEIPGSLFHISVGADGTVGESTKMRIQIIYTVKK